MEISAKLTLSGKKELRGMRCVMMRKAGVLFGLLSLFPVQEGLADVHIGDLEIFLSRLEIRVNRHEREVNERIVIQKMRIAELEDRIVRLEALLKATKRDRDKRPVSSAPASL